MGLYMASLVRLSTANHVRDSPLTRHVMDYAKIDRLTQLRHWRLSNSNQRALMIISKASRLIESKKVVLRWARLLCPQGAIYVRQSYS